MFVHLPLLSCGQRFELIAPDERYKYYKSNYKYTVSLLLCKTKSFLKTTLHITGGSSQVRLWCTNESW